MGHRFTIVLVSVLATCGCAGPMNPFGAIKPRLSKIENSDSPKRAPSSFISATQGKINFIPARQNWHQAINFKVSIKDFNGIGPRSLIKFFYNDQDITDQVIGYAQTKTSPDNKVIVYTIKDFRLKYSDKNKISVSYQRDDHSSPLFKHYQEPNCPINSMQKVRDLGSFKDQAKTFRTIETISLEEGLNPNLMAGLIAQESGFDPHAISWAKAIGLTQVTSLAEQHVLEYYPSWPRFEGISDLSYPSVKSLILLGEINSENEWRLNKEMSIKGGIEYIRFVQNYWSKKSNQQILKKVFKSRSDVLDEVILASYNSGPYRVRKEITRLGKNWLESKYLGEAKKYVHRVKSYCYHFSNPIEPDAPLQRVSYEK